MLAAQRRRKLQVMFCLGQLPGVVMYLLGVSAWYESLILSLFLGAVCALSVEYAPLPAGRLVQRSRRMDEAAARACEMVQVARDGIVMANEKGEILEFNPAAEEMFGFPASLAIGSDIGMLMPKPYRTRYEACIAGQVGTSKMAPICTFEEFMLAKPDGERFPAEFMVHQMPRAKGGHFIIVIRDVSRCKRAEDELSQERAALEQRILQRTAQLTQLNAVLGTEIAERKKAQEQLTELAATDGLTNIFNRREFDRLLQREFERATRYNAALAIVMFDIDHFKSINDRFGHLAGDAVLVALTAYVGERLRASDMFARWGGEEFAILLPGSSVAEAHAVAEKLRTGIAERSFAGIAGITCSFGISDNSQVRSATGLTRNADAFLYQSKQSGRNRVSSDRVALDRVASDDGHAIDALGALSPIPTDFSEK